MNYFKMINENSNYKQNYGNAKEICDLGEIDIVDFKSGNIIKVDAKKIVRVVNSALTYMDNKFPYLFLFLDRCKIMYIPVYPCKTCDTMQVDDDNNLWINMNFVYNQCDMDKYKVFGILFHEMFHIFLDHLGRFNDMFRETIHTMSDEMLHTANVKANISMDYEINASMVADGIVDKNFWKNMGGLYKKEYTGKTWETIYRKYGDKEYTDWLEQNGMKINKEELEILNAIEKAAKVLNDPTSTDKDKAKANRELQKTIDKILGKNKKHDIQDIFEEMKNTQLSSYGEIEQKMQNVIDDLYKDPSKMSDEQYNDLLQDIDEMSKEIAKNTPQIAERFGKTERDTFEDIKKMRNTLRESMAQLRNNKMSKTERKDILDKIKDSFEDIISNDVDKKKNEKIRKEREEERNKERKEELKANSPLRKLINVFKNLINLCGDPYYLVCQDSCDIMENIVDMLDSLTEMKLSEITKDDIEDLKPLLSKLKDSLFTDLKELLNNKTILHKTEDDLHRVLDGVFEFVENALFTYMINSSLDDDKKSSVLKTAADKMRIIGKILKTQKAYRASDEFKEEYRKMRDDLFSLFKTDKKAVLKKLYDMGLLDAMAVMSLDKRSKVLYDELVKEGKIKI